MASRLASLGRPSGTRFLEVGCGFGLGLDIARRCLNWDVIGVDPSRLATAGREQLDLPIEQRLYTIDDPLSGPFDVVHASEFLEHVSDPLGVLRTLRSALAPDGTLLLTTPAAEMIRPDTPDAQLLPLLSVGWHVVLQTQASLAMLLRRAGFIEARVWREGAQLIAIAGRIPELSETSSNVYLDWLKAVVEAVPSTSDLGLGTRARLYRELAVRADAVGAESSWQALDKATRQRFGKGLAEFADAGGIQSPVSFEDLAEREPLFLGGVFLWRAFELMRGGGSPEALFRAARDATARLRTALRTIGIDDGDAGDVTITAQAELAVLGVVHGAKDATARLDALARATDPEAQAVRRRCFVELVNRGRLAEARMLGDLAPSALAPPCEIDHLRASVVYCAAALELQLADGRRELAREWLRTLRSLVLAAYQAGSRIPARELYWPAVEAEVLALKLLGQSDAVAPLVHQSKTEVAGWPGLERAECA
jgi:hypothetical protein